MPVAARMNLQASQIVVISPTQFNAIPQGKDYFPDGVYLQNQETGEIARYDAGKRGVVSSPIASRLGLTATDLISVSAGQYNAVDQGPDYIPDGLFLKNNVSYWLEQLEKAGVPCGPVNDFAQVFADPHVRSRGMEIKVDHPLEHSLSLIRNAITFSGTPVKDYRAPPLLGANTRDVLATIGYDDAKLDALKQQGII